MDNDGKCRFMEIEIECYEDGQIIKYEKKVGTYGCTASEMLDLIAAIDKLICERMDRKGSYE